MVMIAEKQRVNAMAYFRVVKSKRKYAKMDGVKFNQIVFHIPLS